jgi:hypothetical protein
MEVQELAETASLGESQLRPLVGVDAPQTQVILARRIVADKLVGVEIERLVRLWEYKDAVSK